MKQNNLENKKVRSLLLEIPLTGLPATGIAEFKLGSNPQLRDCVGIISVEAFNATLMSKGPSGATNLPDAGYKTMVLSIFDGNNTEVRSRIPAAKIIRSNGNSAIEKLNLFGDANNPNPIDPERSKITIADASTGAAAQVVLIEFTYLMK